jgi:hypothetical protein
LHHGSRREDPKRVESPHRQRNHCTYQTQPITPRVDVLQDTSSSTRFNLHAPPTSDSSLVSIDSLSESAREDFLGLNRGTAYPLRLIGVAGVSISAAALGGNDAVWLELLVLNAFESEENCIGYVQNPGTLVP